MTKNNEPAWNLSLSCPAEQRPHLGHLLAAASKMQMALFITWEFPDGRCKLALFPGPNIPFRSREEFITRAERLANWWAGYKTALDNVAKSV
jgi:hypothetical protein